MTTNSPNKAPIYPIEPIKWRKKLSNQIVAREVTTETPVLLGTAGANGSLIDSIEVLHLGDNVGTTLRFYTQKTDEVDTDNNSLYYLEIEQSLSAVSSSTNASAISKVNIELPAILPSPQKGLRLTSSEKLYCALGTAIVSGVIVKISGGNY